MRSTALSITRLPSAGAYYVQGTDPALTKQVKEGDLWWDTTSGSVKVYRSNKWQTIKLSGVSLMDACITNNLIANDINASKIAAGRLESRNGEFVLDLDTGEAILDSMTLGGRVEGNVIAESNDGLMRILLVGKDLTKNVSAQIALEGRADTDSQWEQKGLLWLGYGNHQSYSAMQGYYVGTGYNRNRPTFAANVSAADGILCRPYSQDWLRAAYVTYHGMRLVRRDAAYDTEAGKQYPWDNVPAVNNVVGNFLTGATVGCMGSCTMTYTMNDVARIDFDFTITTSGTGSGDYGLSRALLRQINNDIPVLSPIDGGTLNIYSSAGALVNTGYGGMMVTNELGDLWVPAVLGAAGDMTPMHESDLAAGMRFTGVCYATYSFNAEEEE